MIKVSIIIPFNNVEQYIEQCLDSVINQTLKDIEIILINDASNDKSRELVQHYINNDERIKIIDINERKGQGYARNRGIEIARGQYIGFVDSDDFIEKNMFEKLYNTAVKDDTDITMCMVNEYDDINGKYISSDYYSLDILQRFEERVFSAEDTKNEILDINMALWNKIYKRDFLLKTGEKFPEGFIYEDLPFFFGTYSKAQRINIVWKILYHYRINRKNSTMVQFNNKILDRIPMVSLTYEKLKNISFLSDMKQKIQGWIINDLFHRYILMKENYHREYFFLMKKVFQGLDIKNPNDWYWKTIYHFNGYLLVMNNSFEDFTQKIFNEYLDIREIENRLHSEITDNFDIEMRLGKAENLLSEQKTINEEISEIKENFNMLKQEQAYIKKVLLNSDLSKENINSYSSNANLKDEMNWCIKNETNNLYNDIKDLSYVLYNNYVEMGKNLDKTNTRINNLEAKIDLLQKNIEKDLIELKNEIKNIIEKEK